MEKHFEWGDVLSAQAFAQEVKKQCDTCQACDWPHNKLGPIVFAPIPPVVMAHVAIDVFAMPPIKQDV